MAENVVDGTDTVLVDGKQKHILSYLQDFLFSPDRARSPVSMLSGGERNRLLLARLFTQPANVLVLDEPTNDLDAETMELLEELLVSFGGTLLLVSHDRDFLDNVVTSTLVFEGDGRVGDYVGGFSDWQRERQARLARPASAAKSVEAAAPGAPVSVKAPSARKLSNKERQELAALRRGSNPLRRSNRSSMPVWPSRIFINVRGRIRPPPRPMRALRRLTSR